MISVWPLESDSNVIHQDLFYSFLDQLYATEGILKAGDLTVAEDTDGIGVIVSPGGAVVQYDSVPGGKRVFYNSAANRSGSNKHPNASFDTGLSRWTVIAPATYSRDTGTFHSSPASCKIVTSGVSSFDQGIRTSPTLSARYRVNPAEQQEVSCWVNAPVGTTIRFTVSEYTTADVFVASRFKDAAGTGAWQKITIDPWVVQPHGTSSTTNFLRSEILIAAAGSVNVFVDDFQCRQDFNWIQGFEVSDPTFPRVDRVVVEIRDSTVPGTPVIVGEPTYQDGKFRVISGTPTSGATLTNLTGAAAIPNNCILLANVLVASGATVLLAANIDNAVKASAATSGLAPVGVPMPYMGSAAPSGYLLCNGAAISRTTYPQLFAVCGTAYGAGDGSTTFNLPDMRGRVPVGLGTHADVDALGDNEGEATVGNRRPKHKHTVNETAHSHTYTRTTSALPSSGGGNNTADSSGSTVSTSAVSTGITIGPQANSPLDGTAYLVFNYIVRAA